MYIYTVHFLYPAHNNHEVWVFYLTFEDTGALEVHFGKSTQLVNGRARISIHSCMFPQPFHHRSPSRSSSALLATRYCSWENTQKSQGHLFVFMVQIPGLHSTGRDQGDERPVRATPLQFHQKMSGAKRNEHCTSLITVFFTLFFYNDLRFCLHV